MQRHDGLLHIVHVHDITERHLRIALLRDAEIGRFSRIQTEKTAVFS